jgi:hypothetical protein
LPPAAAGRILPLPFSLLTVGSQRPPVTNASLDPSPWPPRAGYRFQGSKPALRPLEADRAILSSCVVAIGDLEVGGGMSWPRPSGRLESTMPGWPFA